MFYPILKVVISAVIIMLISEVSKRSTTLGDLLASIPFVSLLAILWLYWDTKNTEIIAKLSTDIFWLVLISLIFFILFPIFLRHGMSFYKAFLSALFIMLAIYSGVLLVIKAIK